MDEEWTGDEIPFSEYLREEAYHPAPDPLDPILDVDGMLSSMEAHRLHQIDCYRLAAHTRAAQTGHTSPDLVERSVRLELAAAMRTTEHEAAELMVRGQALVHRYPSALDSLGRGRMTRKHAELLVSLLDAVDVELVPDLVQPAVALAEAEPVGVFRRKLRELIERVQAPTIVERHEAAVTKRRVLYEPDVDGMAWLSLYGPAVELKAGYDRITRMGKAILHAPDGDGDTSTAPDGRTLDQIRADVLGDLLVEGVVASHPDGARGIRAEVVVTVPALSLLDDECAAKAEPARVEGVGPIPIGRARELCGNSGNWMRILTHPETGMVVSVGRDSYRPPRAIRRLVRWRAGRCLAPGCGQSADRCHIDHNVDWALGGETEVTNLNPLCVGHHVVKHGTEWEVRQLAGGVMQWTSPNGRVYLVEPERRLPAFTVDEPAPF
ncbi:MAG TPA: DUF222 domain-containing protein [Microbacterium sp.]|uniref:HNH endonuclease signature motif containing protein n=1 Tax=Microbacterium sp. TaxID=51671 RepID=UPI002B4A39E2|nr:DUF222 domain-containing protein [Microbacterium sp.]HKT57981.1 DUF222 domain-containing protein [Microbacterium sp.]